jgi:methionine-rich copper-binding protein CopC
MNRRARTTAGLLAALAALLLAAGMVPAVADPPKEVERAKPRDGAQPNRAPDEVVVTFSDEAPEDTSITVLDACDRTISAKKTTVTDNQASVELNKAPRGRYRVRVSYTVVDEPESPSSESPPPTESPSPSPTETPDERTEEKWGYSFRVQTGPACDGSDDGEGGNDDGGDKKKRYSWGSTNDPSQHGGTHAASPSNPITAGTTHSGQAGSSSSPSYSPGYSPFYSSPSDSSTHSAVPDFDSSFGDSAFDSTTEDTPLSDPTDPTLADPDAEVIAPEKADDEQSLSAAPNDSLEPEAGVLVVALAAALLLGAGGGLFLRKADPAPSRK